MLREIDINEISDGKRYHSNDMVKIECCDCNGCSSCCHDMGDSIILDPRDIFMLQKGTGRDFNSMIDRELKLRVVEGLILPCINMSEDTGNAQCSFLNSSGRCSIHEFRPGFCRLFPLGRIYEDDSFSYFVQTEECPYPNKSKVKIKKWLGIPNLGEYEKYILHYHNLCKKTTSEFASDTSEAVMKSIDMMFLKVLFSTPYNTDADFYEQYYSRVEKLTF